MIDKNRLEQLYKQGLNYQQIANIFGCSRQRIHQLLRGYSTIQNKEIIRKRFNFTCQLGEKCNPYSGQPDLQVHHFDQNSKNNKLENLWLLCKDCHIFVHEQLNLPNRKKYICKRCKKDFVSYKKGKPDYCEECFSFYKNRWSRNYDKCTVCLSTKNKFENKGMCTKCYYKYYWKIRSLRPNYIKYMQEYRNKKRGIDK